MIFPRVFARWIALASAVSLSAGCGKSKKPPAAGTKLEDVQKETAEAPRKDVRRGEKMPTPSPTVPQKIRERT